MFNLYLKKKIFDHVASTDNPIVRPKPNRRISPRYQIDHKHLTLMNEQDIIPIIDISDCGFATVVSSNSYPRFITGDIYEARIRYGGEIYEFHAKVSWKHDSQVGFEILNISNDLSLFLERLIYPVRVASSFQLMQANFLEESKTEKDWLHSELGCDLYLWHDKAKENLEAWQLNFEENYVEWNHFQGLTTGRLEADHPITNSLYSDFNLKQKKDNELDKAKLQFSTDVFMAMDADLREKLLKTVSR